jgi:hypothetical protein
MEKEIIYGTKVILEFLDIKPKQVSNNTRNAKEYDLLGVIEYIGQDHEHFHELSEMFFHESYDWLCVPIQKLQREVEAAELGDLMHDVFFGTRITAFRAVVKEIKARQKKYEVFVNGSWDAEFGEVPFVQVFFVGEVRMMSKSELEEFADHGDYDSYLCPELFSNPDWNGEIKFIREEIWKQKS